MELGLVAATALNGKVTLEAMLLTFKEIFGTMIYVGLAVLVVILLLHFQQQVVAYFPKWKNLPRKGQPEPLAAD